MYVKSTRFKIAVVVALFASISFTKDGTTEIVVRHH